MSKRLRKPIPKPVDTPAEPERTFLAEFQVMVEELRIRGFTDTDVHSIVNMILAGWFHQGKPTQEYLERARAAAELRADMEQRETRPFGLVDQFGTRLGS